jgi:excisionase family DNA binding protein
MNPSNRKRSNEPLYYTPEEAAALLRVDRRTIYEWLRSGKMQAVKFGKTWRIHRSTLFPNP